MVEDIIYIDCVDKVDISDWKKTIKDGISYTTKEIKITKALGNVVVIQLLKYDGGLLQYGGSD